MYRGRGRKKSSPNVHTMQVPKAGFPTQTRHHASPEEGGQVHGNFSCPEGSIPAQSSDTAASPAGTSTWHGEMALSSKASYSRMRARCLAHGHTVSGAWGDWAAPLRSRCPGCLGPGRQVWEDPETGYSVAPLRLPGSCSGWLPGLWLRQGGTGSGATLSESLFLPSHQDWQRDRPSLPNQGPEEGRVLPPAGPVQPPPQEQPQRKAVRDGPCLGDPEKAFPFL